MTIGYLNRLDLAMDMTEITGLDDMHYPEGIILKAWRILGNIKL